MARQLSILYRELCLAELSLVRLANCVMIINVHLVFVAGEKAGITTVSSACASQPVQTAHPTLFCAFNTAIGAQSVCMNIRPKIAVTVHTGTI
jgi:hypothetical protein